MKQSQIPTLCLTVVAAALLLLCYTDSVAYQLDTTKVREKPPEESQGIGETLLRTPEYILKTPVWAIEGFSDFTLNEIVLTDFTTNLIEKLTAADRVWGFFPLVSYGSNSGIKYGLTFTSEEVFTRGERVRVKTYYSSHDYSRFSIQYAAPSDLPLFRRLLLQAHYKRRPWEQFYGLGNGSSEDDEVAFTLEESYVEFGWFHLLHSTTRVQVDGAYTYSNIYDGEDPDLVGNLDSIATLFDLNGNELRSSRVWSIGLTLDHDWRDHPGQPSGGGQELLSVHYSKGVSRTNDLEYLVFRGDLRHYLEVYKKRVIALRFLVETTELLGDSPELPFYLRRSLGGEEKLRGYPENRFLDHNLALAAIEWRYPIWKVVDGFVFFEEGRVFDTFTEDFTLDDWHYSAGAGLRIWRMDGLLFSSFFGISREGFRAYAQLSEEL